jgi:hypothetical protein
VVREATIAAVATAASLLMAGITKKRSRIISADSDFTSSRPGFVTAIS